jgi:hypothetical protein
MRLSRHITGLKIDSDTRSNEKSYSHVRSYKNETGRAKHNRRAKLQHITDAKPLEFMAIAKREAFKEARSEAQRNDRRAKRK